MASDVPSLPGGLRLPQPREDFRRAYEEPSAQPPEPPEGDIPVPLRLLQRAHSVKEAPAPQQQPVPLQGVQEAWGLNRASSVMPSSQRAPPEIYDGPPRGWPGSLPRQSEKGDYSDPPSFPGFQHYRIFKKALVRWDSVTDVKPWRRAEKVLRLFDWTLMSRFDHLSEQELQGPDYLQKILEILDLEAGVMATTEKHRLVREALFEHTRQRDESVAQYVHRRHQQFIQAENVGVAIPSDVRGALLEEGAGLNEQGVQNLRTLTGGSQAFEVVRRALLMMEAPAASSKLLKKTFHADTSGVYLEEEVDSDIDSEDEAMILFELDKLNVSEEECSKVWAVLEQGRRRTWKENKDLRRSIRKDRQHFDRTAASTSSTSSAHNRRLPIDKLKLVTKCAKCGQKGHWARECPNPAQPRSSQQHEARSSSSAFVFSTFDPSSSSFVTIAGLEIVREIRQGCSSSTMSPWNLLSLSSLAPGQAILDIGAGEDLIGASAFEQYQTALSNLGWQGVILPESSPPAKGVGGSSRAKCYAILPVELGGRLGFVKTKVLEESIPHLLSVGLLDSLGACINLPNNTVHFKNAPQEAKVTRSRSGHRVVNVLPTQRFAAELVPVDLMCSSAKIEAVSLLQAESHLPHGVHDNRFEKPEVTLDPCCESSGLESNASASFPNSSFTPPESASCHVHSCGVSVAPTGHYDAAVRNDDCRPDGEAVLGTEGHETSFQVHRQDGVDSGAARLLSSTIASAQGWEPVGKMDAVRTMSGTHVICRTTFHQGQSQSQVKGERDQIDPRKRGCSGSHQGCSLKSGQGDSSANQGRGACVQGGGGVPAGHVNRGGSEATTQARPVSECSHAGECRSVAGSSIHDGSGGAINGLHTHGSAATSGSADRHCRATTSGSHEPARSGLSKRLLDGR